MSRKRRNPQGIGNEAAQWDPGDWRTASTNASTSIGSVALTSSDR